MKALSIRWRIQLWFAGLCALLLLVFAAIVTLQTADAAQRALDERLALRADALLGVCEVEDGRLVCELAPPAAAAAQSSAAQAFAVQALPALEVIAHGGALPPGDLVPDAACTAPGRRYETRGSGHPFRVFEVIAPFEDGEHGPYQLRVVTAEDMAPLHAAARELAWTLSLGGAFTLLGVLVAGWLLARRIVDPLARLARGAEGVQAGRREALPRSGNGDEVDQLAATLERTLQRLHDAHDRQARFTADAAHELRTPLAIIRTQADVALQKPRATDSYRASLREVLAGAVRMSDVVESLLLLARADAGTLDQAEQDVDLAALVRAAAAAHGAEAAARQLRLRVDAEDAAPVRGDARLLSILFDNLIGNAIRYSDGPGDVTLRIRREGQAATLSVEDQGIGIAADRQPYLFERFFRADADRSRSAGGAGLGLAIVRAIADRHGASCRVDSQLGRGSRFEVEFPLRDPEP